MGDRRGDHRGYGPSSRRREEDDGWGRRYGRREEAPQISDRRGDPRSRYDERRDERRDECRDERRDERPRDDARRPDERRAPGRRDERRRYARPREEPARQEDEGDDEEEESEEEEEEEEVCANAAPAKQRAVAPQAPPPVAAGGKVSAPPLTVSRCQNDTISDIIAGVYLPAHMNHGKVVYKKQEKSRGLDVLIYYWDDRDGPELCGWWFGPNVGGDQVWAYHPSRTAATPPASEWNVPHDGPIDSSFSVAMRNAAARAPSGEKASPSGEKAPAERRRPEGRSSRAREESAPVGPPRSRARSRTAGDRNSEAERSRREGSQPPKVEELSSAPPGGSHAYFLDAYNRRRQERLREQRQKEDEPPPARAAPAPPPPPSRREEPPRQPDRRDREPDRRDREPDRRDREPDRRDREPDRRDREPDRRDREPDRRDRSDRKEEVPSQRMVRQLQDMKEVMERQAEEERRQVEELKRRADERKRMEEEFQRKMKDILDKPRPELPGDKDDRDRRRRGDHEDRSRDRGERARERRNDRTENWDREDGRRPERRRGREDEDERASKRRREDGDRDEERRRKQDEERRRHDERRKEDEGERKRREEQERIKREEEKRRKEEDMRRREEELQRKRDEKRRLEDEERKKTEEERRAKLAEERRRDEERRKQEEERNKEEMERRRREEWQRHEEELQRRAEEDKRKAEDEQKRREEEAKVLRQQQATLSVLRVLQKLSNASPDDFESLNKELEEVLNTELPETGAQQEILKAEADRVLEYAKQYVEQVREQQKKWEELREQQAKKQEELEATARAAIQELQASVTSAEAAAEGAHYTAAPLAGEHEMEVVEVLKLCRTVEKTGKSAMTSCQACLDLVAEKKATIEEAENIRAEAQQVISQVQPRVQAATRLVSDALAKAKDNKERIAKRLATAKRTEMRAKLFAKYDEDGDGRWNRKEIAAYAKGEFNFDMPEENLDRILRQVCGGEGASIDCLQILKVSVGIARDEDKGKVKRAERLERERIEREERERREAELQGRVEEVSGDIKELQAELQKLDPEIHAAEGLSEALVSEANSDQLKDAEEARVRLKAIESIVQTTHAAIAAVRLKAQELSAKVAEDKEIADLMITDFAAVASKTEAQDFALRKALSFAEQARQLVLNRAFEKYETLRMEVASKLRVCIELQGGKPDDLYAAITTAGSNVTKKSIKAYLEANQSLVEDEKLDKVFPGPPLAEKDKEAVEISKEDFMRVVRIFYKVVKEIVLSDNLLIEQSDQLRRMDVGEIIEVFQGPMLDPSVGVYRIHGKALKDGIVGWATVAGNQGITFLMPDNNLTSR